MRIIHLNFYQAANRNLRQKDSDVQESQFKILKLNDEIDRLKKLVETSQVGHLWNPFSTSAC